PGGAGVPGQQRPVGLPRPGPTGTGPHHQRLEPRSADRDRHRPRRHARAGPVSPARTFPAETASVREARDFVAESLGGVADEQVEIILLATSELAANSVRHAG